MAASVYDVGDLVRVSGEFKDLQGNLTDPSTVKVSYRKPDGVVVTKEYGTDPEVNRDSLGIFSMDIAVDQDGRWWYQFIGEGTLQASEEKQFSVRPQIVTPAP